MENKVDFVNDDAVVYWTCPHCGTYQDDSFIWTAVPLCAACDRPSHWDEILTPDEIAETDDKLLGLFKPVPK